jgi:hypothetical protein
VRHYDVEHHNIRVNLLNQLYGGLAVVCSAHHHHVGLTGKELLNHRRELHIVVHEHDAYAAFKHSAKPPRRSCHYSFYAVAQFPSIAAD